MARLNRTYLLTLANGQVIQLKASSLPEAYQEVLVHFGATLSHEEPERRGIVHWNALVTEVQKGTPATRAQVEALMSIRGLGAASAKQLAYLAGKATVQSALQTLRGRTRGRADEVVAILNRQE
jgi:hypothetical protein